MKAGSARKEAIATSNAAGVACVEATVLNIDASLLPEQLKAAHQWRCEDINAVTWGKDVFVASVVAHCQQQRRAEFAALLEQLLAMAPLDLPVCECVRENRMACVLIDVMLTQTSISISPI